jgi:hypothetical protein
VAIYEADGETLYWEPERGVPVLDGNISVDQTRDERRTLDLTLADTEGMLEHNPWGGFWYDKVIKVFRGSVIRGISKEYQIGEFLIDSVDRPHFPNIVKITGRDYSKKLITSKLRRSVTYSRGTPVLSVVRDMAVNGGIDPNRLLLTPTGHTLGRKFSFERGADRWTTIKDVAEAYSLEVYFDRQGHMVLDRSRDPSRTAPTYTFQTGTEGNLASYSKQANDTRIYNHIIVSGESTDTPPATWSLWNSEPSSPTNVDRLGYRTYVYTSPLITNSSQARAKAYEMMNVMALEEFTLSFEAQVVPYLEAGSVIEFIDPRPGLWEPVRYLLSSINIPLALGTMNAAGKRVLRVGGGEATDVPPDVF